MTRTTRAEPRAPTGAARALEQRISISNGQSKRLVDHDMLAGGQRLYRLRCEQLVQRGEDDEVHAGLVEQLFDAPADGCSGQDCFKSIDQLSDDCLHMHARCLKQRQMQHSPRESETDESYGNLHKRF